MRIEEKFIDMRRAFRTFDKRKRNCVGFPEFLESLDELGMRVNEVTMRKLFDKLDEDGSGTLDYEEFCMFDDLKERKGDVSIEEDPMSKEDAFLSHKRGKRIVQIPLNKA